MPLRVVPLGGLGEIGMNSMLFDDGESALLIDAGLMFPDDTMLGIDYVIPDFGVLREIANRLKGVLLTHGHEDHIGAVSFLLKEFDVPVHGTPLTLGLLRHRLEEHGLDGAAKLVAIGRSERFRLGNFDIEAFPACHSIPDGVGYILRCGEGVFVHTGDFKIDPRPPDGVPPPRAARGASRRRLPVPADPHTGGHDRPDEPRRPGPGGRGHGRARRAPVGSEFLVERHALDGGGEPDLAVGRPRGRVRRV